MSEFNEIAISYVKQVSMEKKKNIHTLKMASDTFGEKKKFRATFLSKLVEIIHFGVVI